MRAPAVLQHCRSARYDPAGDERGYERARVGVVRLPVAVRAQNREEEHLRHEEDQDRHERSAEGASEKDVRASVRFSFGRENTLEEADKAISALKTILPRIRREEDLFAVQPSDKINL